MHLGTKDKDFAVIHQRVKVAEEEKRRIYVLHNTLSQVTL